MTVDWLPETEFHRAIDQFNRRDFFECHETLETLWNQAADPAERNFYQGILQVGVGFYHLGQNNFHGASTKLSQGLERLKPLAGNPKFEAVINLDALIADAGQARERVLALGPEKLDTFPDHLIPRIRLK